MNIIPPYVSNELDVHYEIVNDKTDHVERTGFVPPDVKIQSFIDSGNLLQNYRAGGETYEIEGDETELESDSPEFADELTHDAENYDEKILPQYYDTISAHERMDELIKNGEISASEKKAQTKKRNLKMQENDDILSKLSDSVAQKIIESAEEKKTETATK